MSVGLFLCKFTVSFFLDFTYKEYHICLFLAYFIGMIISRSVHVDANGIILFFFYG